MSRLQEVHAQYRCFSSTCKLELAPDAAQVLSDDGAAVSDKDLCAVLKETLNIDASKAFSSSHSNGSAAAKLPQKGALQKNCKVLTVEDYVSQTLPLLELEKDAEVAQVGPRTSCSAYAQQGVLMHDVLSPLD